PSDLGRCVSDGFFLFVFLAPAEGHPLLLGASSPFEPLHVCLAHGLNPEELLAYVVAEALHEAREHLVSLALVFLERVSLGVAPEAYALPQMVHAEEMVFPEIVECLEHDVALDLPHHFGAELFFLG